MIILSIFNNIIMFLIFFVCISAYKFLMQDRIIRKIKKRNIDISISYCATSILL